jgi:UDP-2,3-diacylglucosamine hydrolase
MSNPKALSAAATISDDRDIIYFVSDIHLGATTGPREVEKRDRLQALLDLVEKDGASLYCLGDLFDFWFEYKHAMPSVAFRELSRLDTLARNRTPVSFLGGNHDFWIESFLERETSIRVIPDGTVLQAQGRSAWLTHGDGLGSGDTGYKILKKVTRNAAAIRMFRLLHPDAGIGLALSTSHSSRKVHRDFVVDTDRMFREVVSPRLASGADAVLMGHHHLPFHQQETGREWMILGNWFQDYTCARLQGGTFTQLRWPLSE